MESNENQKKKPKYGCWSCVGFMLRVAWQIAPSVIWLGLAWILLSLGIQLTGLYIAPVVLEKVESHAALGDLLGTIGALSGALVVMNILVHYDEPNAQISQITVRSRIMIMVMNKSCTTSYPNTRDPKVISLLGKVYRECMNNNSSTEHIWLTIQSLLLNLLGFASYLTLLVHFSPALIALVIALSAANFFVSERVNEWSYRHRDEEAAYDKKLMYLRDKAESVEMAKDIRIFGLDNWLRDLVNGVQRLYDAYISRRERVYMLTCLADTALGLVRNGIAYAWLIARALRGELTPSEFLLYFTAFSGFSTWVTGILEQYTTLRKECVGVSTVLEYLNQPEQFRFEGGEPVPRTKDYELKLENVSFRYPGTEQDIIRNMNLTIRPGEKLAVVGLNGAGKTTLVKLLCGFYDPDEGRVTLNGTDIRRFNRKAYYALFSAVFQSSSKLDLTVAEAVAQRIDKDGIDMARVKDCVRKAGLTETVETLPNGYDTHLGKKVYLDGVHLSGGQSQRMMLARALYKDGPILVLDEPTSALDPIAESDIYQKYNEMTAGKTSVFISHRLASTRFCDRILFLQDGVVAEEGTHEELLRRGGLYAELFNVQARYYQEGGNFRDEAV